MAPHVSIGTSDSSSHSGRRPRNRRGSRAACPWGSTTQHAGHTYWLGANPGFFLLGAAIAGVVGTLYFGAAATVIGTLISWWQFRKALREPNNVRDSHQSRSNGHQRPDSQEALPGAGYPDEESAGPGYSSPGYSDNGQSGTSYASEDYGRSGYGDSQYRNPQSGKSQYGSGAYGVGGYGSQGTASAGQAGTGGAVGYRDAGYGGGGSGAAYGDQGHQGADDQDPSHGQRHYSGFGRGPGSAYNGSANGHAVTPAYQGGPSRGAGVRCRRKSPNRTFHNSQR